MQDITKKTQHFSGIFRPTHVANHLKDNANINKAEAK